MAPKLTCFASRLYFVVDDVVTVSVPARVRRVSVEPLTLVTVPVSPPQNPLNVAPKPALVNPPPHENPKPPRPKDGECSEGAPLGVGVLAVVLASVTAPARLTTNPPTAPATAMATAIPTIRRRPRDFTTVSSGGGGGGGSQLI